MILNNCEEVAGMDTKKLSKFRNSNLLPVIFSSPCLTDILVSSLVTEIKL